jgi:hypothetical protein
MRAERHPNRKEKLRDQYDVAVQRVRAIMDVTGTSPRRRRKDGTLLNHYVCCDVVKQSNHIKGMNSYICWHARHFNKCYLLIF